MRNFWTQKNARYQGENAFIQAFHTKKTLFFRFAFSAKSQYDKTNLLLLGDVIK